MTAAGGGSSPSSGRRQKLLKAVRKIDGYHRGLRILIDHFGDEKSWVERWIDDAEAPQDVEIAAIERQFERIVNAWQDEVFDVIEREAAAAGKAPRAPVFGKEGDAERWNSEALTVGLVSEPAADPQQVPNRWDRQVLLGYLDSGDPPRIKPLADTRQLFTHRYTGADDEVKGRYVWQAIQDLDALVPEFADRIERALDDLWD